MRTWQHLVPAPRGALLLPVSMASHSISTIPGSYESRGEDPKLVCFVGMGKYCERRSSTREKLLIYVGLRVTNIERSLAFYSGLLGLEEIGRGGGTPNRPPIFVLLQDPESGQKLELNWYPEGSPYAVPYVPGEGLDHVGFKVASVLETLRRMRKAGVKAPSWTAKTRSKMVDAAGYRKVMWMTPNGHRTAYILDPDGNYVELYDHPELGRRFPVPKAL